VYAGVDGATVLHYQGGTWNDDPTPADGLGGCYVDGCWSFWGSSPTDVYAVGDGSQHWDGNAWSTIMFPLNVVATGVWGSAADDVYVVGGSSGDGVILHSADRGSSWTVTHFPMLALTAIAGSDAHDIYIGATGGTVLHTTDGTNWTMELTGAPEIHTMWSIDRSNLLAAGDNQILWLK
jgi:hypothetical protein